MSVEHLAVVLHHSKMSGTPKVVLLGIANHDGDGGAWPETKTLAKYARVTVRNVQKAIQECVAAGELRVEPRWKMTPDGTPISMTNRYHLLVRCPPNCDRSFHHRESAAGQQGEASSSTAPPVADDTRGGVADDTTPLSQTTPKPSLNRPSEPQTPSVSVPRAPRSTGTRIPDDFGPTTELIGWARANAPHAGTRDHEQFVDYWRGKPGAAGKKADWPATWRNWMRKASDEHALKTGPKPSTTDQRVQQAQSLRAAAAEADAREALAIESGPQLFVIEGSG